MHPFTSFFLMTPEDAKRYAVEVLDFFRPGEDLDCTEIGDGNINYVFKVWSRERDRSVVIKQADRLLRSSGRPLDMVRSKLEAQLLQLEGELAPGFVPEVYRYDEVMAALSMEDISAYGNLRKELAAGGVYGHLAENPLRLPGQDAAAHHGPGDGPAGEEAPGPSSSPTRSCATSRSCWC